MSLALKLRMAPLMAGAWRRDRWDRPRIEAYQARALARLLAHAASRSPYYRGRVTPGTPLRDLPILTKAELSAHWDEIVTDRRLSRARVTDWLADAPPYGARLLGGYHAVATSGSTGDRMPFVYSQGEWARVMTSAARLMYWRRGFRPGGLRLVSILSSAQGSTAGAPMSLRMGEALRDLMGTGEVLDQSLPTDELVARLNALQPNAISTFASTLALLAGEQMAGRLNLHLKVANASAEVLTNAARGLIEAAFGVRPHNTYGMSEAGAVAATCRALGGMHILDDMTLLEVVDDDHRPAAPGTFGSRVLLTNLWARTLPLIRYEITDRVRLSDTPCACGLPFPLIADIDGRAAEVFTLPGRDGAVRIAPWQVHRILYGKGVTVWQLVRRGRVVILRAVLTDPARRPEIRRALAERLRHFGADIAQVRVEVRDTIDAGPTGKVSRFVVEQDG